MFTIFAHICGLENLNKNWKTLHLVGLVLSYEHPHHQVKLVDSHESRM